MKFAFSKSTVMPAASFARAVPSTVAYLVFSMVALCVAVPQEARADFFTNTYSFTVNQTIPDNDQTGFADTHLINGESTYLDALQLTLNISGGYNGDLYAYVFFTNSVQQSSAFSVLLNRPGRTASDDSGYSDSGMNITFDDQAPNGDIHVYQTLLDPHGGILTGFWQPDARNVHPDFSFDTTARTADLSGFTGLNPNGSWTLFVADNSALGVATLQSWQITMVVPEPTTLSLATFSAFLLFGLGWTRRRNQFRP
jgi:subtilisin-like proprotein convertase family protein